MDKPFLIDIEDEKYQRYFSMVFDGKDFVEIEKEVEKGEFLVEEKKQLLEAIDEAIVDFQLNSQNNSQAWSFYILSFLFLILALFSFYFLQQTEYAVFSKFLLFAAAALYYLGRRKKRSMAQRSKGRTIKTFKKFKRF